MLPEHLDGLTPTQLGKFEALLELRADIARRRAEQQAAAQQAARHAQPKPATVAEYQARYG